MVVLVVEVLDALKVERLDDSLGPEVELGAAARGHHGRPIVAVDLNQGVPTPTGKCSFLQPA